MAVAEISTPLGRVSFAVSCADAFAWQQIEPVSLDLAPERPVDAVWRALSNVVLDQDQEVETVLTIDLPDGFEAGYDGAQWIVADLIEGPQVRGHLGMPDEQWYASKYGLDLKDSRIQTGEWCWSYRTGRQIEIPFQAAIAWTSTLTQDTDALATWFALDTVFIPRG
jgi:hypothetical protein